MTKKKLPFVPTTSSKKNSDSRGFSLIEVLVAIVMFTLLAVVATQTTVSSLQGSRRSDASTIVRQNLEYSLSVMERYIRNASSIPSCTGVASQTLAYLDEKGTAANFSCTSQSGGFYLAKDGSRLTSNTIVLTACSFTCIQSVRPQDPPQIQINLSGQKATADSIERTPVTISTKIYLRTY